MTLDDRSWARLLRQIRNRTCTPVIGAGASARIVPSATRLAQDWAAEFKYPLADKSDLARVSQYIAISEGDAMMPKELMLERLKYDEPPNLEETPYPYLAQLPFSLYITTNYDDLIARSLAPNKIAATDYCRWNNFEEIAAKIPPGRHHEPTEDAPLVYHLHGAAKWPASLVLTEEDYVDFLITAAETSHRQSHFLRDDIRTALAGHSLLFVGYRLSDWTFRVLFRGLMRSLGTGLRKPSVSIQLVPDKAEVAPDMLASAQTYIEDYLGRMHGVDNFTMFWGDATAFARELRDRWQAEQPTDGR